MEEFIYNQWSVGLTPQEEALAMSIGFARQFPYFGKPEANRRYDEGAIWETQQHAVAVGAEIAWAKMIGLKNFIPTHSTHKDEPDVGEWEVRHKPTRGGSEQPYLRLSGSVDDHKAPYVLLTGGAEIRFKRSNKNGYISPPYVAHGWCYANDVMVSAYESGVEFGKPVYRVPVSALRPLSEVNLPVE